jgi:thioredoxin-like negative regulator of GroEL
MKSSGHRKIIALLCGVLLLTQILPAWAQVPAPPGTLPQVLEFDRKLCPICRKAELIMAEVKEQYPGQFTVRRLYIDEHGPMFRQYRVAFVPTQVFLDAAGQEVFRHEGVFPKEKLLQKLRDLKFIQEGNK